MTFEAPITRVINILIDLQDKCTQSVSLSLDEAIEILRSPELYQPCLPGPGSDSGGYGQFSGGRDEADADEITSDLFTGLIHSNKPISGIRRMSYEAAVANRTSFSSLRGDFSSPSTPTPTPSLTNVPTNIRDVLDTQLDWDSDVIHLEQITARRPLVWLGLSTLTYFDVLATLNCDEVTLRNWLTLIEGNYRDNPYHNSTHAADVMQATAYFLAKPRLKNVFDPFDEAICLIAAIIHDIDHPGKTSAYLCNSTHELAILYNDISVLESHHAALAFRLTMKDESTNIFKNLDKETFKEVRHSIIDMVLATEMTKHFEHLTKFVNVFTKSLSLTEGGGGSEGLDTSGGSQTLLDRERSRGHESPANSVRSRSLSLSSPENVVLIKRMLIKCADVSNPCRPLHLCSAWAQRIAEEYCNQTDEEKAGGLPVVMPVFDRATCSIPKSQMGFIDFFANDMFEAWDAFGDFPELIELLRSNYGYWQGQQRIREASRCGSGGLLATASATIGNSIEEVEGREEEAEEDDRLDNLKR